MKAVVAAALSAVMLAAPATATAQLSAATRANFVQCQAYYGAFFDDYIIKISERISRRKQDQKILLRLSRMTTVPSEDFKFEAYKAAAMGAMDILQLLNDLEHLPKIQAACAREGS